MEDITKLESIIKTNWDIMNAIQQAVIINRINDLIVLINRWDIPNWKEEYLKRALEDKCYLCDGCNNSNELEICNHDIDRNEIIRKIPDVIILDDRFTTKT